MAVSKRTVRILELSLIFSCLTIAEAQTPPFARTIHNEATLAIPNTPVATLAIYNDSSLKTSLNLTGIGPSFFSLSTIYPDYGYRTIYGVLTTNITANFTLNIFTKNWNPSAASDYATIYAYRNISSSEVTDFNYSVLQVDSLHPTVMEISLTLYVPTGSPSTPFVFDITFTTEEPARFAISSNDDITFSTATASLGHTFTLTLFVLTTEDTYAYQCEVDFNSTQLSCISAIFTNLSTSQFFAGHNAFPIGPTINNTLGTIGGGETLLGQDVVHATSANIINMIFQIIQNPPTNGTLTSLISLNPSRTFLLDPNINTVPNVMLGHVTYLYEDSWHQ